MTSDVDNDGPSRSQSPEDSGDQEVGDMAEHHEHGSIEGQGQHSNGQANHTSNAKDPQRPRRKKARRACHACQRAHLTCGEQINCVQFLS